MRFAAIVCLAFGLLAAPGKATAQTVALLLSGPGDSYVEFSEAVRAELRVHRDSRVLVAIAGSTPVGEIVQANPQLLITVGARAAQAVLRSGEAARVPVLCALIPKVTFDAMIAEARSNQGRLAPQARAVSALFLDQPLARQLELVRQLLSEKSRVGVVFGPDSAREQDRLQAAAATRRVTLVTETVARDTELFPALQRVMADSDAFLALPDPRVINADTAQNLLLTSFRTRKPVIGYSSAYVRAGALAAVYSTPAQIGSQAGRIADALLRGGTLPAPQFPAQFEVSVNRQVARSLGVQVDDENALRERIVRQERE